MRVPISILVLLVALSTAPQAHADDDRYCNRDFKEMWMSGFIHDVSNVGTRDRLRVILVDEFQWYATESKANLVPLLKCRFGWDRIWKWHQTEFRSKRTDELLGSIDESERLVIPSLAKPPSLLRRCIHSVLVLWARWQETQPTIIHDPWATIIIYKQHKNLAELTRGAPCDINGRLG